MNATNDAAGVFLLAASLFAGCLLFGCNRKEKIVDVNTPNGGLEIERATDSGDVTVTVGD